jgi:hypothetical protein
VAPYVRTAKTASGATAVQVVYSSRRDGLPEYARLLGAVNGRRWSAVPPFTPENPCSRPTE